MNKINSVTHIFFDLDGTLYNSKKLKVCIFLKFFSSLIISFNFLDFVRDFKLIYYYRKELENLRYFQFNNNQNVFDTHIETISLKLKIKREIVFKVIDLWFNQIPLRYLSNCMPTDVQTTLSELKKRGYKLGILSDYFAIDKLSSMNILTYFDSVVSSQDIESNGYKPHNNGINRLMKKTNAVASQCCYVGDRIDCDVLTSHINNILPILLSTKNSKISNIPTSYIKINSLKDLLTAFR